MKNQLIAAAMTLSILTTFTFTSLQPEAAHAQQASQGQPTATAFLGLSIHANTLPSTTTTVIENTGLRVEADYLNRVVNLLDNQKLILQIDASDNDIPQVVDTLEEVKTALLLYLAQGGKVEDIKPTMTEEKDFAIIAGEQTLFNLGQLGNNYKQDSFNSRRTQVYGFTNSIRSAFGAEPLTMAPLQDNKADSDVIELDANTILQLTGVRQSGLASWYGPGFHGRRCANGERFNMNGKTAASRTLPFGTLVKVTNKRNGKSVVVRINDRGPFSHGRIIDLSKGAAQDIGLTSSGVAPVQIDVLRKSS